VRDIDEASLFNRKIEVDATEEDGRLRMKGRLFDTRVGEPLHGIEVEMLVEAMEGTILEISGSFPELPLPECRQGLQALQELVGTRIVPGFTDYVKSTVGSNRGCTHLAALIMTMGNVTVQGRGAWLRKYVPDEAERALAMEHSARELGLIDSCVSWAADGPILTRYREGLEK
jgi:hypothetical protein